MYFASGVIIFLNILLAPAAGFSQGNCSIAARIEGTVTDPSGAIILGAQVQVPNGMHVLSNAAGHYTIACVPPCEISLGIEAQGFATISKQILIHAGETATLNVQLAVAAVETDVQVNAQSSEVSSDAGNAVILGTYDGGLIEITTKPGTSTPHGAAFFTGSVGELNATDPFSLTATPAGKRRYGFELSGAILPRKADYSLAFERRDIDEFNVVNARVPGDDGVAAPLQQTVPASQRLWIGSARTGWQLGVNDTATLSFAANVNTQGNQGVGGQVLPEAGYTGLTREYDLRVGNTQTFGANLMHETRIGYSWKRTAQAPNSATPALQVAGYFTRGGATAGDLNTRERDLEVDDDIVLTRGRHTFKLGLQSLTVFLHNYDPDTFNGAFVFGGGSAPQLDIHGEPIGQTTTIDGLEQYERTLKDLPGGHPTTYQLNTGNPVVPIT